MKKILSILSILVISSIMIISVSASSDWRFIYKSYNIPIVTKNPVTWEEVWGAEGNILLSQGHFAHAIIRHAQPFTDYTLIYYGDATHNDVWNYATCISSVTTNNHGNGRTPNGQIDYTGFINDGKAQKFWVVLSNDIDCKNNRMTAWNPTKYLFETYTI